MSEVIWHGEDIGRWLATQRRDRLDTDQLATLAELGVDWAQ
ncbi:hypothetical protein ACFXGI_36905 [Streptomyces sp. NPDC059355]